MGDVQYNIECLATAIQEKCPDVIFAFVHGSAKDGVVREGSDLDIAVYVQGEPTFDTYQYVNEVVSEVVPHVKVDVGILNGAEPVYCFEALKGTLLFTRDEEAYVNFYSLTSRLYESQMIDYERQQRYRKERDLHT